LTKRVLLKKGKDHRLLQGHLWVFSNEIESVEGTPAVGEIVDVRRIDGKLLGRGFYHPHSLISVRIMTWSDEDVDSSLISRRITSALSLRRKLYPECNVYRLVHGEGDFIPGLIIDRYNDIFSLQTFSAGLDLMLPEIVSILDGMFSPRAVIERNESPLRSLEGLASRTGTLKGAGSSTTIEDGGIKYAIDVLEGQKTGFYLDQRENRRFVRKYAAGGSVLDCFCNDGGFSLNAAAAGASKIVGIDSSDAAVNRARKNAELNAVGSQSRFSVADVFEFLGEERTRNAVYDAVILDPPSFTKSRKTVNTAKRGYKEINTNAMKLVAPGGILASASCSHHITEETFLGIIEDSAADAGRRLQMLEWHGAAPDHPVLPAMPETKYLKFGIFRIL